MTEAWFQLLPWAFCSLLQAIPAWIILKRIGLNRAFTAFAILPWGGAIILLFIFAYSKWSPARS